MKVPSLQQVQNGLGHTFYECRVDGNPVGRYLDFSYLGPCRHKFRWYAEWHSKRLARYYARQEFTDV